MWRSDCKGGDEFIQVPVNALDRARSRARSRGGRRLLPQLHQHDPDRSDRDHRARNRKACGQFQSGDAVGCLKRIGGADGALRIPGSAAFSRRRRESRPDAEAGPYRNHSSLMEGVVVARGSRHKVGELPLPAGERVGVRGLLTYRESGPPSPHPSPRWGEDRRYKKLKVPITQRLKELSTTCPISTCI